MALLDRLTARVERHARQTAEQALRLAEVALTEFPDLILHREGNGLVISGRGLMRRWLSDVRLRFMFWKSR